MKAVIVVGLMVSGFMITTVHSENGISVEQPKTATETFQVFKGGKQEDYVDIKEIVEKLDCKGNYTNGQRQLLIGDFISKRVKFSQANVFAVHVDLNKFHLSSSAPFKTLVTAIPANKLLFKYVTEGKKYDFDCKIKDYCKSGLLDMGLTFTDCYINY